MYLGVLLLINIFFIQCGSPGDSKIPIIIDADTANEIDDLYAIVLAVLSDEFDVKGVTSAQFHTSPLASDNSVLESQKINEEMMRVLDITNIPLPLGSNYPLTSAQEPEISEASSFIVKEAKKYSTDNPLQVVILGSCTNVASAILQDPSIIPNIEVHYIGFWHDTTTNVYDKKEFNSGNDTLAVDVLLNIKDLNFNVMTATTCQHLVFDKAEVDDHLKGKGGIADYLVNRWETYDRWWTEEDPEKLKWIMWDVAIIEALKNPEYATIKPFKTPPENTERTINIYTDITVDSMIIDFWNTLE